jgi:acetyltransferase-like isoleucine patch superfamily enzyme
MTKIKLAFVYALSLLPFSGLKVFVLRVFGAKIGRGVHIGLNTLIWTNDLSKVIIGNFVNIGNNIKLIPKVGVFIGDDSIIKDGSVITGKQTIKIGKSCYIGRDMFVDCEDEVIIGDRVFLSFTKIFTHNYSYSVFVKGYPVTKGSVRIGSDSWIGPNCFIVPGIKLAANTFVSPESMIISNTEPFVLYSGNPARPVMSIRNKIEHLNKTVDIKQNVIEILNSNFDFKKELNKEYENVIFNVYHDNNHSIFLLDVIDSDILEYFINLKIRKRNLLIITFNGNKDIFEENHDLVKKKITVFNISNSTYFPNNFTRNSMIFELKGILHEIGIFLSSTIESN